MQRRQRKTAVFSLSFLDCICCGFGAIILLFIVSMGVRAKEIADLNEAMNRIIQQRLLQLNEFEIQTEETTILLAMETEKTETKAAEINTLESMISKLEQQIRDKQFAKDKFLVDIEQNKKELAVTQKDIDIEQKQNKPSPVGISVESNHIVFVIDTSGSMRDSSTSLIKASVVRKFEDTLDSYPEVKGIQLMDANGHFIMGRSMNSQWLKDSPETRAVMVRSVRLYPYESESNPAPGIIRAIRVLAEADNEEVKMGIYVFGDEFAGRDSEDVIRTVNKINRNKDGSVIARINAVGFPNVISQALNLGQSGLRFANLMRELTYDNDGAFVALEDSALNDIEREERDRYPMPPPRRPSIIFGPGI